MEGRKRIRTFLLPIVLLILLFPMLIYPTLADDQVKMSFNPDFSNEPPYAPINPDPANGSVDVDVPVTLSVEVYDPDSLTVDVYFYNASNDTLIGVDYNVPCGGSTASVVWNEATYGRIYFWYAVANDDSNINRSETWAFTTRSTPPPPPGGGGGYGWRPNQYPIANITGPHIAYVNETVIFYSYYSYDPDGYIVGYNWDFENDSIFDTDWIEDVIITHKYSKPGNYIVTLQVKDNIGAIASTYHKIKIIEIEPTKQLPVPKIEAPDLRYTNESINFSSNGSYDPDGVIVNYSWDFGDGSNISFFENPIHIYSNPGNYTVILMVRDNDNLRNGIAKKIIIVDKEKEEKPKKKEYPLLLLLLILMAIIATILALITMQRKYRFTFFIEQSKASKKKKDVDNKVDDLISELYKNIKEK